MTNWNALEKKYDKLFSPRLSWEHFDADVYEGTPEYWYADFHPFALEARREQDGWRAILSFDAEIDAQVTEPELYCHPEQARAAAEDMLREVLLLGQWILAQPSRELK